MGSANNNNPKNEMTIIYKIGNKNEIRLFGEDFVKNNRKKCKVIIGDKEYNLIEFLNFNKCEGNLKITLKEIKTITNMSSMFYNCNSLMSLPDICYWNTNNVQNMENLFRGCTSLISLPNISKYN